MAKVYKGAGTKVARLPGIQPELDVAAMKVMLRAKAEAAASIRTGHYESSFEIKRVPGKRGVTDRLVVNNDEGSVAIEYGHVTPASRRSPGRFVPGKFILTRAVNGG